MPEVRSVRSAANVIQGRLKWFNMPKGYGFITVPGEQDVFLHIKVLNDAGGYYNLMPGTRIVGETEKMPDGRLRIKRVLRVGPEVVK